MEKRTALSLGAGLGAGTLLALSFPPYNLPALLPLGIAALLWALRGLTVRLAVYTGLLCGAAFFGGTVFWLTGLFGAAGVSLIAILAAFIAAFAGLYVWLQTRLPRIPVWLLAPMLWTAIEYYRAEPFPLNFGWMGLGYAVAGSPWLAAGASVVGVYGLTFGIIALGASFTHWKRGAVLLPLWAALCFLPRPLPAPNHPMSVKLVQAQTEDEEALFGHSHPIAGQTPSVIVWAEYSFDRDPRRTPKLWHQLQNVARDNHCYFIFGAKDQFDPNNDAKFRNTAFVLDPQGSLVGTHVKNHPVHFISDGVAGTESKAIPTALGRLGVAICFDMDYPDVARRLAQDGASVFLVPNDDPAEWGSIQRRQHRLLFQMRAAECGRWLARADVSGGTSVSAPTGQEAVRVLTTEPTALLVTVGRETGQTWFTRGGWRFGQTCFMLAIVLCAWGWLRRNEA